MPTEDTSQTTRTKMISGRALSTFHILNPQSPQGGDIISHKVVSCLKKLEMCLVAVVILLQLLKPQN